MIEQLKKIVNADGSSKKLTSQSLEDFRNLFNMLGSSLESSWEAFAEDQVGTLLPMAVGALAMKYNFLTFGLTEVASFMGHVAGAGFIGSGGYILYEAASGDSEQAKTDALRFVISVIPVAGGIQITGGSGTGTNDD